MFSVGTICTSRQGHFNRSHAITVIGIESSEGYRGLPHATVEYSGVLH